jgi:hypothetical protein
MGLEAGEHDGHVLRCQGRHLDVVGVGRVHEQGDVEALEQAVIEHDLLPAPPLLGRRAQEPDLPGPGVPHRRQGDGRTHPGRGHRVVAAPVTEPGQRVVLRQHADLRPVGAQAPREPAPYRGREAAGRVLHGVPVSGDELGDPGGRLHLLERRLRVGVDSVRQAEDLVPRGLHGGGGPRLEVGERLGGTRGKRRLGHGDS